MRKKDRRKSRIKFFSWLFIIIFTLLAARFVYIVSVDGEKFSQNASANRTRVVTPPSKRGMILDCNGIPFVSNEIVSTVVVDKQKFIKTEYFKLHREQANIWFGGRTSLKNQYIISYSLGKQLENLKIDGIQIIFSLAAPRQSNIAKHIIGYLDSSSTTGVTGLQRSLNYFLSEKAADQIEITQNAQHSLISGIPFSYRRTDSQPLSVQTTLDYNLQKIVEDALDANYIKRGAAVVIDVKTGEIKAMASRPTFDVNSLAKILKSPDQPLINRAITAYNVGSIFKIVDTVSYLELIEKDPSQIMKQKFVCTGSVTIDDHKITCSGNAVHGEVDLNDAFVKSCNSFFVNLSTTHPQMELYEVATRLGLGRKTGITDSGISENLGHIPNKEEIFNPVDLANITLGQGNLTATPLQVCSMTATIANNGIQINPYILKRVTNSSNDTLSTFRAPASRRVVSERISQQLKQMMINTVLFGTGKNAAPTTYDNFGKLITSPIGAGGKTGTAETPAGNAHAWFTGFSPAQSPKYAITVFVENGGYGSSIACPVFNNITSQMLKQGYM